MKNKFLELIEEEKKKCVKIEIGDYNGVFPGPARACYDGKVLINKRYIENDINEYPPERLIVVLHHELGHIKEFEKHPMTDIERDEEANSAISEEWAFRNSLEECKKLFINKDEKPLRTAMHYIAKRKSSGKEVSYYQTALDNITKDDLWKECDDLINPKEKSV